MADDVKKMADVLEKAGVNPNQTLRELRDRISPGNVDPLAGNVVAWDRYVLVVAKEGDLDDPGDPNDVMGPISLDTKVGDFVKQLKKADLKDKSGNLVLGKQKISIKR